MARTTWKHRAGRRLHRTRLRVRFVLDDPSGPPVLQPLFVCGVMGSGTSLLSQLLDSHYEVAGLANESALYMPRSSPLSSRGESWGRRFLADHRQWLSQVSTEEGFLREIERGYALNDMSQWNFQDPDILEVRFETLIADPVSTLLNVFAHYELQVP